MKSRLDAAGWMTMGSVVAAAFRVWQRDRVRAHPLCQHMPAPDNLHDSQNASASMCLRSRLAGASAQQFRHLVPRTSFGRRRPLIFSCSRMRPLLGAARLGV